MGLRAGERCWMRWKRRTRCSRARSATRSPASAAPSSGSSPASRISPTSPWMPPSPKLWPAGPSPTSWSGPWRAGDGRADLLADRSSLRKPAAPRHGAMTAPDIHGAIDAVWRIESAKVIAGLARIVGDVGIAEELAQDALVAALERWPESGMPRNPGAWLMATAKHRAIDHVRRDKMLARKHDLLGYELEAEQERAVPDLDAALDDQVGDDLLRLVFIACHPVLSTEARAALTLRLLGGLTTEEIARAFLVPVPTIAQRIVRAKRTLSEAHVPFEVPRGAELTARVSSVLGVIYLIFNEGYSATAVDAWMRPNLCEEALRLGRIVAELAPFEPEVHGLVSLMEIQASRLRARVGPM